MAEISDKMYNYCIHNQKLGRLGGFNPDLLTKELSPIESEMLTCSECKGILREPQHLDNSYRCKECLSGRELGKHDEMKSKIIGGLGVRCPFKEDGCVWEGTLSDFLEHSNECNIIGIQCPFSGYGCHVVRKRKDMETHEEMCLMKHLKLMKDRIDKIEREVNISGGIEWEIKGIKELIYEGGIEWSSCFYVGLYKFQVSFQSEFETEPGLISVLIYVCKGDFDEDLEWPFCGKFNITIVNKCETDKSISYHFMTDESNVDAFVKPFSNGNSEGYGCPDFVSDQELLLKSFSEDNSIILKVFVEHTPKWKRFAE